MSHSAMRIIYPIMVWILTLFMIMIMTKISGTTAVISLMTSRGAQPTRLCPPSSPWRRGGAAPREEVFPLNGQVLHYVQFDHYFDWSGSSSYSIWSLFWSVRFFIVFNMIIIIFFIIHSVVILALSYQYDHYKIALNWLSTTIFSFFELITNYQSLTCCWFSRWVVSRASMHCLVSMNAWVLMI